MLILDQKGTNLVSFKDLFVRKKCIELNCVSYFLLDTQIADCDVDGYALVFYELEGSAWRAKEVALFLTQKDAISALKNAGKKLVETGFVDFSASGGE